MHLTVNKLFFVIDIGRWIMWREEGGKVRGRFFKMTPGMLIAYNRFLFFCISGNCILYFRFNKMSNSL